MAIPNSTCRWSRLRRFYKGEAHLRTGKIFALGALALVLSASSYAKQVWKIAGGTTNISFLRPLMKDLGLDLGAIQSTAEPSVPGEEIIGFEISESSDFRFETERGVLTSYLGGSVANSGSFQIGKSKKGLVSGFAITANGTMPEMGLTLRSANGTPVRLRIANAGVQFDRLARRLVVAYADLTIDPQWALSMGKPGLADQLVGSVTIDGIATRIAGPEDDGTWFGGGGGEGDALDLALSTLTGVAQVARLGTYPNGQTALSMSTTSCNYGTVNINWYAPMDVRHPVIGFCIYRVENGRFEQINYPSWLKHGFLATNSGGCGTCQNPGTGELLGPGCSDTYGTSLNADRYWLGPRNEVNPFTGVWTCTGSWFSNYLNDCVRRNNGSGLGVLEHRMVVNDGDLGHSNAVYYYEAYYITAGGDINKYNQVANRTFTANWTGTTWSCTTTGSHTFGCAIQRYGDINAIAEPRGEGDFIVAVDAIDTGTGTWRYEFAVYNHDSDRKMREFVVPIIDGATVTNIGFGDVDDDAGNNWSVDFTPGCGQIRWYTQTFQENPNANALAYQTTYNFWFETNQAPLKTLTRLQPFKPGSVGRMACLVNGPLGYSFVDSHQILRGVLLGGTTARLECSDDVDLAVGRGIVVTPAEAPIQVILDGQSPSTNPDELRFKLEASVNTTGLSQEILFWDFSANQWVPVDNRAATTTDSVVDIALTTNIARFVDPTTRGLKALVRYKAVAPVGLANYAAAIDRAVWTVIKP